MNDPNEPAILTLEQLLLEAAEHADALYLLGDFFDSWIGDDDDSTLSRKVILLLKKSSDRGLPIYFMHGNRDFLIGNQFASQCGIQLLPDPSVINLYQQRALLMHGDILCSFDHLHQFWFKLSRHRLNRLVAKMIPLSLRHSIAKWLRKQSKRHQFHSERYRLDVDQSTVIKIMQQHNTTLLIHGHTHLPGIHVFDEEKKFQNAGQPLSASRLPITTKKRIVLGAWHQAASVLYAYEDGEFELKTLPFSIA